MIAFSSVHKAQAFAKCKGVMQGFLGPCARARVTDLWSFDPDKPASPAQRADWFAIMMFIVDSCC